MVLKILILLSTFFISLLSAAFIDVAVVDKPVNILKQTKIYVDKENQHDFKYILENNENLFKENIKERLHLSYTTDAIWLKFTIKNSTNSEIKKVLEISNPMLDNIFLYTKQFDGSYTQHKSGLLHNTSMNENILNMYFTISISAKNSKEFYLKASSLSCALFFELNIMSKDQLYKKELNHQLILALFFGSIIALIIYNLFIYFYSKDLVYLYYIFYLTFTIMEHLSYTSLNLYLFSQDLLNLDVYLAIIYISFLSIFTILFTREFLNVKRYKKLDYIFKLFLVLNSFFILFTSPEFYPLDLVVQIGILTLFYNIFISLYLLYKGEENAKYMAIGWSIAMFGWIMQGTYDYGTWSLINSYPYFFELAIFTEAVLFSVVLANKLNKTKELEKSVATNKVLTRELHHRVKNNMQFIISMYRLKLANYSNKDISNSLKEVEGTIQAMSDTHEMLYTQKMSTHIATKEYFTTLIQRLKNSYDTSNIKIDLNVDTDLNIDNSIYIGIILNELITNSFKYAFENKDDQIFISLSKQDKNYHLVVQDNGIGFDDTQTSETFGIELVKTLVEDELKGTLELDTSNGCKYSINWK